MMMNNANDGQVVLPPVTTPTEMNFCSLANRLEQLSKDIKILQSIIYFGRGLSGISHGLYPSSSSGTRANAARGAKQ